MAEPHNANEQGEPTCKSDTWDTRGSGPQIRKGKANSPGVQLRSGASKRCVRQWTF